MASLLAAASAWGQAAVSEGPIGQWNFEVLAGRDQNLLDEANFWNVLDNDNARAPGSITIPAHPANRCQLIDVNAGATQQWEFRCHDTGGSPLTLVLEEILTGSNTASLTNKTFGAEGTGNTLTTVERLWLPAASCSDTTPATSWSLPTSGAAAAACLTGTNIQGGVLDFDAASDEAAQRTWALPADWTGAIDARLKWLAAATSGDVGWCVQLVCVADGETDDPAFPAQAAGNCVSDTAKGTTLQSNDASKTGVTSTGCAAGELLHIQVSRDADGSAVTDDMSGDAHLVGVELTLRRAQ